MEILSRNDLKILMREHKGPCISMFMPTYRVGAETQQGPIRFKNLVTEAEKRLIASGLRAPEAKQFLEPAQELLQDSLFWQHQSDGLAVFLSADMFRYFRLPLDFEELVVVTGRFHLKPLLPVLSGGGRFYILALSQNKVRLLQGTRYSVREIAPEGIPQSLSEALKYDDPERQLQFHTQTPTRMGKRPAIFHGHGVGTDDVKNNILRYFRQINRGLRELLKNERAPLVVAGVDYLFPIYREANTYPHLVDEGVAGNPEELSEEKLHEEAWAILQPHFQKAQRDAVAHYKQFLGTQSTSNDVKQIVPAAHRGRVDVLFVAVGLQQWGAFDPDTCVVQLYQEAQPGLEDLSDLAAMQTLLNGGTVYAVEPEHMPDDTPLAAVFRY